MSPGWLARSPRCSPSAGATPVRGPRTTVAAGRHLGSRCSPWAPPAAAWQVPRAAPGLQAERLACSKGRNRHRDQDKSQRAADSHRSLALPGSTLRTKRRHRRSGRLKTAGVKRGVGGPLLADCGRRLAADAAAPQPAAQNFRVDLRLERRGPGRGRSRPPLRARCFRGANHSSSPPRCAPPACRRAHAKIAR